ncbi:MAG TPA: LamG domain-containing protein [Sedimentisphaerales bacterium]|nr:LamG domain-containing protein [Sedimentisphaerales bacterium]
MKRLGVLIVSWLIIAIFSSIASASLVAHWDFNGNTNDISGNENHGTVHGAVTLTTDRFGNLSSAYSFDGASGYIDVADAPSLNPTSAITITAWFKADSFASGTAWPPLVKKSDSSQTNGYGMEFAQISDEYSAKVGGGVYLEGQGWVATSPLAPVSVNTWYFAAIVYDGETISNYVRSEGQEAFTSSISCSGNIIASSNNLNIGRDPSNTGRYFEGVIDDVRIYNQALSSTEIEQIYNVPEPATLLLLGLGGFMLRRKR